MLAMAIVPVGDGKRRTYKGCVHIHSVYSDGGGTLEEIMQAAQDTDLDFVIVTDHNSLEALKEGKEGWYGRSLLLIGVEISFEVGHYLAFDVQPTLKWDRDYAQQTIDGVVESGGFGIIAHPDSQGGWKDWDVTGYVGLEITNLSSLFSQKKKDSMNKLLLDFARGGFRDPERAMKRVMSVASDGSLQRWSKMLNKSRMIGFGGTDAHGLVDLGIGKLRLPWYSDIFKCLQLHIVTDRQFTGDLQHDKEIVYGAIRGGQCYTSYSVWGDTLGFDFTAKRGGSEVTMGQRIAKSGMPVTLRVQVPGNTGVDCRLFRGDKLILDTHQKKLFVTASRPGAYRVEVDRHIVGKTVPWIVSNPIYVDA